MIRMTNARLCVFVLVSMILAASAAMALEPGTPRPFAPVQEGFSPSASYELPYHPERILIKFKPESLEGSGLDIAQEKGALVPDARTGIVSVDALCDAAGVKRISRPWIAVKKGNLANELGLDLWYMLETDGGQDALDLAGRFSRDPSVAEATVDWRAFPAAVPSDPMHYLNWEHNNTSQMLSYDWSTHSHENGSPVGTVGFDANAHAAWDNAQGYGNSGIVIAIIDSGVEAGHPDLRQVAGYDYGDNDSNADDNSSSPGHGTACAGVAAAMVNNGLGTAGVAGGSSIMPLKVANSAGSMYFSSIQNALYHAADNGAEIASMSLGAAISSDSATDAALAYAYNAGVTLLAATGNENASTISYPAINQYVIAVGAASPCGDRKRSSSSSAEVNSGVSTDPNGYTCDGERWWGSNYGTTTQGAASAVDVIAPTILPTTDLLGAAGYDGSDYSKWFNGTSCATPYAAGVAALVKAGNPSFTPAQIRDRLRSTAQDVVNVESGSGWDRYTGYGMVDAAAATGGGTTPTDAVTVTYPNGGETLTAGDVATITWSWTGTFTTVAIEYSLNGGSTWSFITSSTTNDGSYGWTVPTSATTQARIRITGGTAQDASNSNFTIDVPSAGGYATLPYSAGFEGGAVDQYWTTASTNVGRVLVTTTNTPHGGSYHLTMDSATNGTYCLNEAWLHLDLAGQSQVDLGFWWKDFGDETHSQDGVYFSSNGGSTFVKVQDLNGASYSNNVWRQFALDVDALASANGLSLSSTFVVKFQQYDNYQIATDGFAFDDVSVAGSTPPADAVTVTYPNGGETLTGGGSANITWTSAGTFTTVNIDYSTNGGTNWTSIVTGTANDGSYTWSVPAVATTQGRVRVTGGSVSDTSNANFTIEYTPPAGDYATLPYSTGFEGGAVDQYWTTASTAVGRVRVTTSYTPHGGSYHLTMDSATNGTYSLNEAVLHLDLAGESQVDLSFWWKEFGDETHSQDGVYFSANDGATYVKVQDLNGASYSNQTWNQFTLDVDALAAANGLTLGSTFLVKFQQYDNYVISTDGFAFDDVSVTVGGGGGGGSAITAETEPNGDTASSNGPVGDGVAVSGALTSSTDDDYFWFDVTTAGNINISVAIGGSADLDWYLYNSSGTQVDRGYTVSNPEAGSYTASVGRYYLRVDGYLGATSSYTLTVTGGLAPLAEAVEKADLPMAFSLKQNAPNPFNPATTIKFDIPKTSPVKLRIYDQRGRLVRTLVDQVMPAGSQSVMWHGLDDAGRQVTSGVYLYLIEADGFRDTKKMTLLK
ncbi:S8 family serine peptidase [bacterium]|nr:S8 family serine peptidase [bacterium]